MVHNLWILMSLTTLATRNTPCSWYIINYDAIRLFVLSKIRKDSKLFAVAIRLTITRRFVYVLTTAYFWTLRTYDVSNAFYYTHNSRLSAFKQLKLCPIIIISSSETLEETVLFSPKNCMQTFIQFVLLKFGFWAIQTVIYWASGYYPLQSEPSINSTQIIPLKSKRFQFFKVNLKFCCMFEEYFEDTHLYNLHM